MAGRDAHRGGSPLKAVELCLQMHEIVWHRRGKLQPSTIRVGKPKCLCVQSLTTQGLAHSRQLLIPSEPAVESIAEERAARNFAQVNSDLVGAPCFKSTADERCKHSPGLEQFNVGHGTFPLVHS